MLVFNLIMTVQAVLYMLLGSILFFPGKLLEIKSSLFYGFFNRQQVTTTTPTPLTVCVTNFCGNCENITASGGIISSPNYPNDYGNRRVCIYTIRVPENFKIQLTFTVFTVENRYDWIDVYDGDNLQVPSRITLGTSLTGYTIPSSRNSSSNVITVHFKSDINNSGLPVGAVGRWQATYTVV